MSEVRIRNEMNDIAHVSLFICIECSNTQNSEVRISLQKIALNVSNLSV